SRSAARSIAQDATEYREVLSMVVAAAALQGEPRSGVRTLLPVGRPAVRREFSLLEVRLISAISGEQSLSDACARNTKPRERRNRSGGSIQLPEETHSAPPFARVSAGDRISGHRCRYPRHRRS